MIRIERAALPPGMNAFARRQDGRIVVYVGRGLSILERRAAIREALRAAPLAGWRALRSPVLLPVLAGSAGLRRAPEGRWVSRALLATAAAAAAVAITVAAATLLTSGAASHGTARPPAGLQPGGQPTSGSGQAPTTGSAPSRRTGSAAAHPGSAPGRGAKARARAGAPTPETSGKAATIPAAALSPQPSGQSTSSAPAPGPAPSPSPTGSKGTCVYVLGVLVCL